MSQQISLKAIKMTDVQENVNGLSEDYFPAICLGKHVINIAFLTCVFVKSLYQEKITGEARL